jgi:hypothetical protein
LTVEERGTEMDGAKGEERNGARCGWTEVALAKGGKKRLKFGIKMKVWGEVLVEGMEGINYEM